MDDNGWLTSAVDAKTNTTSYSRDTMGRLTASTPPTGRATTTISYSFGTNTTQTITNLQSESTITYDAMWRPTLVQTKDLSTSQSSFINTTYDAAGQVVFSSFPSSSSTATAGTNSTYDALGRSLTAIETVAPGASTSTAYLSGHKRQITDAEGYVTTYSYTGYDGPSLKTLLLIQQPEDTTTTINRNIWDEVLTLNQAGTQGGSVNQTHTYIYDAQNQYRICRHRTPESGDTLLTFDAAGQLLVSARGMGSGSSCGTPSGNSKVSMTYSALGLPTLINFTNGATPDIAHIYDANGNVEQTNRNGVNWAYTYDNHNALTSESLALDGKTFASSYTYNGAGHMVSRILPSGRNLSYVSDGLGRPVTISSGATTYASGMAYYPSGTLSNMSYGNGQAFSQSLNLRLQPEHLLSQYGANKALDLTYTYDKRGKITDIDNGAITGDDRTYDYDGQGRLTTSTGPWGSGAYSYDPLGNIRTKTEGSRALVMSYDGNNRLTSHTDSLTNTPRSLSYDARGNVTALGGLGFTYDMSDQPISLSGSASGTYKYDGNFKRVKSVVNGKTIYNVYDASGTLIHIDQYETVNGGVVNEKTDYVGKFARITNNTVTYLHNDLLGSAQTGSSANGLISWREQFMPFGETMNNPPPNDDLAGYTGHIKDSATGLNYMQARYYDPLIGRFLSTDPIGFSASRPEMFGRYTYVGNDPMNHLDPDGEKAITLALDGRIVPGVGIGNNARIVVSFPWNKDGGKWDLGASIGVGAYVGLQAGGDLTPSSENPNGNPDHYKSDLRGVFATGQASGSFYIGGGAESEVELTEDAYGNQYDLKKGAEIDRDAKLKLGFKLGGSAGLEGRVGGTLREAGAALANTFRSNGDVKKVSDRTRTTTTRTGSRIRRKEN